MNSASKNRSANLIRVSGIKGEPHTGYEDGGDKGEFECENCHYFDPKTSSCGQKDMMEYSKKPKLKNGRVQVDPEGCCEFVDRMGKVEPHEKEEQEE